jgi:dihydrofolate reductase
MTVQAALPGFAIVVAADDGLGIGRDGKLPWRLPGEMAYFKRVTSEAPAGRSNAVIMGRKTYESIAPKFRPLAHRINIVLSRDPAYAAPGALTASSLDDALALADDQPSCARSFVVGGGEVYRQALLHPRCSEVFLTRVHARFDCDAHLPPIAHAFRRVASDGPHREGELSYTFEVYERSR